MKRRRIATGLLSAILSIIMLIGVFPVSAVTVNAATQEITYISIMDINLPRPDATPDYKATYSTGCTSTTRFDSTTQINGIEWRYKRVNAWKVLDKNDTFKENVQYTVAIAVKAQSGYYFRTNNGSPAVSCTINGNKANVVGITGQNNSSVLVVIFTFPAAEYFTLNTVGVINIDIPQMGNTPDFTAEPVSDRYTVSSLSWFDKTALKYLSATDTFEANHSYMLTVTLNTLPGNKFKTDLNDVADFTAKINGVTADVVSGTTLEGTKASIKTEFDVSPVISKISVSDIELPKAGNHADYTCRIDGAGYELDTYGIDWTKNGGNGSELPIAETFEAGKAYELKIWLKAKPGFSFKTNPVGDVIADVKINGADGEVYISDSARCQIIIVYTVPADITSVGITGITEPFAGGSADMNGAVTGTGYEIANIEWYDSTDGHGNYINNITSFSEGREYTLDIFITTTDNYSFRLEPDYLIPDLSVTINGKSGRIYSEGNRDEAIIFTKFKTPIEVVTVTGIDAPVAGATPDTEAVSTKAGYKVAKVEWYDTTSTPHVKLSATDKFAEGHKYTVQVTLYAINDFIFNVVDGYQEIMGTINGNDAVEYGSHEYGTAAIGYTFTLEEAEIKELTLKDGCEYIVSHEKKTVVIPAETKISDVKANITNKSFVVLSADKKALQGGDVAGTNMVIQVLDKTSAVLSEYTVIVIYDVDGNGKIQANDARLALRAAVSLDKLTENEKVAADINSNNAVESDDARSILRKSVGLD